MKKVIVEQSIRALLEQDDTFLDRQDLRVFTVGTNDEMFAIHSAEHADLIITRIGLPGGAAEELFRMIREDPVLRTVSVILAVPNTPEAIEQSKQCRVNAVMLDPLHPSVVIVKAQQLLNIDMRESLRVLLGVTVDGRAGKEAFYCRSRNISASGMLIETRRRIAEGERLHCQFSLPNGAKIETPAKVIRIIRYTPGAEGHQYGLMFTDIAPGTKQLIADHIAGKRSERGGDI
jgi:DNA-binding NarL/FixJ family response regulator